MRIKIIDRKCLPSLILLVGILACWGVNAQGVATALIGGAEAKSLVEKAGDQAHTAIVTAQSVGDGFMSRGASELQLMADNGNLILSNALAEGRKTLNQTETNFFGQLQLTTANVQAMVPKAFELKDTAVVDVAHLESSIPFLHVPLFVQRVTGLAQVRSESDFYLSITAFGITPGTEGASSSISVAIQTENNVLRDVIINPKASGEADITIKNSELMKVHTDDNTLIVVPVFVKITATEKKAHLWSKQTPHTVTARFFITLYPRQAGTLTVVAHVPVYKWVLTERAKSETEPLGDGTRYNNVPYTFHLVAKGDGKTHPKPGSEKLENVERYCDLTFGNDTALCDKTRGRTQHKFWEEDPDISSLPTEDGRKFDWTATVQGERRNFHIEADRYTWTLVGEQPSAPISVPIFWGMTAKAVIPDETTTYEITGITVTKRRLSLGPGMSDPGFMTVLPPSEPPNRAVYFKVELPDFGKPN